MTALLSHDRPVSDTVGAPLTLDEAIEIALASRVDIAPEQFSSSPRQRRAIHRILDAGADNGPGIFSFGHGVSSPGFDIEAAFDDLSIDQKVIVALVNEFEFEILRSIAMRFRRERAAA
ncbi:hypothetical protein JET14_12115 [Martelella lutilitoris]|uniref:Uncharacterized protein n=1 Tax=Martelella lutilitoris TaxID=2583532 RepID=A0A7T7HH69_9HYPH|nr:hypothetical protein [Martelella lutilitoris]QQM29082.1 hypothetical protein JET14_12115 [Martelella lutilitoris]